MRASVAISLVLILVLMAMAGFNFADVTSPAERLLTSSSLSGLLEAEQLVKGSDEDASLAPLIQLYDVAESLVDVLEDLLNESHGSHQASASRIQGHEMLLEALMKPNPTNNSSDGNVLASLVGLSHGNSPLAPLFRQRLSQRPCILPAEPNPPVADHTHGPRRDMAICALFRNEAEVLDEWIAFHYLQGVKRFILYDDKSSDNSRQILDKYVAMGIVELRNVSRAGNVVYQVEHQNSCIDEGRKLREVKGSIWEGVNWLLLTDVDEFAYSNTRHEEESVADTVHRLWNKQPCVRIGRVNYGSSYWHKRPTEGLVMENYLLRSRLGLDRHPKLLINLQPLEPGVETVTQVMSMHSVRLSDHTHKQPCLDRPSVGVRINHYLRSLQDYETKMRTHRLETSRYAKDPLRFWWDRDLNSCLDDNMAVRYSCGVRQFINRADSWYISRTDKSGLNSGGANMIHDGWWLN